MRLFEYIQQGGTIMYILLILNIVGFAIMIAKFYIFNSELKNTDNSSDGLSEVIKGKTENKDANAIIELTKQEIGQYVGKLEKGMNTVKIIASISPLFGLLGTVIGVLIAFQVMSKTGLNNPSSFAKGISMALLTTVGGMIVAIPHYIGHNYLLGLLDNLESSIEQKVLNKVL